MTVPSVEANVAVKLEAGNLAGTRWLKMSSWNVSQDWTHFPLNHGWLGEQIIYIYNELSFEIFLGPVILMIRWFLRSVKNHCSKIHTKPAPWRGFYIIPWQKPAEAEAEDLERAPFGTAVAWSMVKPRRCGVFFGDKILEMSKDLRKKFDFWYSFQFNFLILL